MEPLTAALETSLGESLRMNNDVVMMRVWLERVHSGRLTHRVAMPE
jgi:hypothetical protein